jgi:hypothetical protein
MLGKTPSEESQGGKPAGSRPGRLIVVSVLFDLDMPLGGALRE